MRTGSPLLLPGRPLLAKKGCKNVGMCLNKFNKNNKQIIQQTQVLTFPQSAPSNTTPECGPLGAGRWGPQSRFCPDWPQSVYHLELFRECCVHPGGISVMKRNTELHTDSSGHSYMHMLPWNDTNIPIHRETYRETYHYLQMSQQDQLEL